MAAIAYPVHVVADDSGTIRADATVAVTSVKDKAGTDVASHGATVSASGANVCVNYDAETKGDAWVVLSVSGGAGTYTGLNAAPRAYLTRDAQRIGRLLFTATDEVHAKLYEVGSPTPEDTTLVEDTADAVWDEAKAGHAGAGTFGAYLDAAITSRSTFAGGAVASVTGSVGSVVDKAGFKLASDGTDLVSPESGLNARQVLALILSLLSNPRTGVPAEGDAGTITTRNPANSATRAVIVVDTGGNITSVTYSPPA